MGYQVAFITGFPHFIAYKTVEKIVLEGEFEKIYILSKTPFIKNIKQFLNRFPLSKTVNIKILEGDPTSLDLGLSREELKECIQHISHIFHFPSRYFYGMDEKTAYKINVIGTENILDFSLNCKKLERLIFYSTAFVSGDRAGVILEDEFVKPKNFYNHYEETKFEAERLIRDFITEIPITIFRPSIVVGDSPYGESNSFRAPYYLIHLFLSSKLLVPLPKHGKMILNIVPADFIVNAIYEISKNEESKGKTFHLVDENPLSIKEIFDLWSEKKGQSKKYIEVGKLSSEIFNILFKAPILNKIFSSQKMAFDFFYSYRSYDCKNSKKFLQSKNIEFPEIGGYFDKILSLLDEVHKERSGKDFLKFDDNDSI
ncbi:SDR family oxidoreductase [bacterium]|nr:SDR family oxidoreductase [bacterium]